MVSTKSPLGPEVGATGQSWIAWALGTKGGPPPTWGSRSWSSQSRAEVGDPGQAWGRSWAFLISPQSWTSLGLKVCVQHASPGPAPLQEPLADPLTCSAGELEPGHGTYLCS